MSWSTLILQLLKKGLFPSAMFQKNFFFNMIVLIWLGNTISNSNKFRNFIWNSTQGFPLPPAQQIPDLTFLYSSFFSFIPPFSCQLSCSSYIPTPRNLENLAAADPQLYRTIVDQIKGNNRKFHHYCKFLHTVLQLRLRPTFPGILTSRECFTLYTLHFSATALHSQTNSFLPAAFPMKTFISECWINNLHHTQMFYRFFHQITRNLKTKKKLSQLVGVE